jgi:hypothetical protein
VSAALVQSAESKPGGRRRPVEHAEVQAAYRASVASGRPLTGAELGRRIGRTEDSLYVKIAACRTVPVEGSRQGWRAADDRRCCKDGFYFKTAVLLQLRRARPRCRQ